MTRVFSVQDNLLHDPATGLTYQAPRGLTPGRHLLEEATAVEQPIIDVTSLPDRRTPVSLCWSPLTRCNLRCPQCLDDTTVPESGYAERTRIATVLACAPILGVDISGGEPLLLKDLPELAGRIRAGGRIAISVTTNGWHLARRVHHLADAVDAIRISLDAPDETSHDTIRGAGSFSRACEGAEAAVAGGIPVQIQTVLMHGNRRRMQDMVNLAERLGTGGVTFLQMLPIGSGAGLRREMLTDQGARTVVNDLRVPTGLRVRLRTRDSAARFTVIRADGQIYRNDDTATSIGALRPLTTVEDLVLTTRDGAA